MGVQKLDIEFEDDDDIRAREEAEKKRLESVEDIEIDFDAHVGDDDSSSAEDDGAAEALMKKRKKKAPDLEMAPQAAPAGTQPGMQAPQQQFVQERVTPMPQAQVTQQEIIHQQAQQTIINTVMQPVSIGSGYQLGDELRKAEATNPVLRVEIEAKIQVAVAEAMSDTKARHAQDTKLLEHRAGKILAQLAAKAPALKKEILMLKKMLADHAAIKKGGEGSSSSEQTQKSAAPSGATPQKKKVG